MVPGARGPLHVVANGNSLGFELTILVSWRGALPVAVTVIGAVVDDVVPTTVLGNETLVTLTVNCADVDGAVVPDC